MADTDIPDPLANWTPSPVAAPQDVPDPLAATPKKGILDTSYQQVPSATNGSGIQWAPEVSRIIDAAREAYESSPPALTYDAREALKGSGRPADAVGPFIADLLSTGKADLAALGAGAQQFAAELMGGTHVPGNLQRDINLGVPAVLADIGISNATAPVGPFHPADAPVMREVMQPPTPTLSDVYRGPLSTPDPVTASAIDMLKRATQPVAMPQPPEAFTLTPGPTPATTPPGGLLGAQPPRVGAAPTDTPILSANDIRRMSSQLYSPADKAVTQGTMLPDDSATAVRKLFSDQIPTDPEQQRIAANQPAVQAARNVDATGPMSFETAMMLDRDLTDRIRAATGTDRSDLGKLQAGLRDQMDQIADQSPARQAYTQYIKQSQMEDIVHDAGLRPPDKQDAYMRQRVTSLAQNDKAMRNWTPEEQAALKTVATSGDIGMLGRLAVGLVKPVATGAGGYLGSFFGPGGTIVGGAIGGDIGATQAANLRRYLSQTTLDPVMRQISAGVPSIPTPP